MKSVELMNKIQELCQRHSIGIEWLSNRANAKQRKIWVKEICGSGDFAAVLHEMGHVICDPESPAQNPREQLDIEVNAWLWALKANNNDFDDEQWTRLHNSLHQYYVSVMDSAHPAHALLVRAEQEVPTIKPRVSSFGAPSPLSFRSGKKPRPKP